MFDQASIAFLADDRFGDVDNTLAISNDTLLDTSLRYSFRHAEFPVNATTLTDKTYVATCADVTSCGFGFKREMIGMATYPFQEL